MVVYAFYESDNRVMRYAETLAARGDDVEVIALRHPGQCQEESLHGVKVLRTQSRTRDEKHKWTYLSRILTFFIRATALVSWRHLRRRYDLVHVHSVPDFLVFSAILPRITGTPVILDIHDILPEFYASKFGKSEQSLVFKALLAVERISTRFASHVIIANHLWYDRITQRSVRAEKCTTIINAPDVSIFKRQGSRRKDGKFVAIYPGTLNWHQGLDIAIRVVARVVASIPDFEFRIYGDGPAKQELMQLVDELGVSDHVHFYPTAPIREIVRCMEEADLGIVPKRANSFGNQAFSTKVLEFMCLGVPVLLSATMIDRYYFNDSVVTFFESGNEEDLERKLRSLAGDRVTCAAQAKRASEFVQNLSWGVYKERYMELLRSLKCKLDEPSVSAVSVEDGSQAREDEILR